MKNLSKLGKALSKAEQKEIHGGTLETYNPCANTQIGHTVSSAQCDCILSSKIWNAECNRCDEPNQPYFDDGQCGQLFV